MEYFKSAWKNIIMNKARTALTMLGIIIGISSVIAILSVGNGLKASMTRSLDSVANVAVTIVIDQKKTNKYLNNDQLKDVADAVPDVKGATPKVTADGNAVFPRKNPGVTIQGGNEDLIYEFNDGMYAGRFFTDYDVENASQVCCLYQTGALYLFNSFDVTGMEIDISYNGVTQTFTIIGVMKSSESDIETAHQNIAAGRRNGMWPSVYMPFTALTTKYGVPGENITSFSIYPLSGRADEAAVKTCSVVESMLDLRGEKAVTVQSFASMMSMYTSILESVTMIVTLVAAISLIVGGIGVMNIMTVTVTERTREIGIRKSLGAHTASIMLQFLIESSMITLLAGFIGMGLGYALSLLVSQVSASLTAVILPSDVILVVSISSGIGIFFGIYPARRAAKLNPIDALRAE